MGKAQERLGQLLKEVWRPTLRDLGFMGSGKVWTLPDEQDRAMLGFQTSQASTEVEAKFTINLMVVGKEAWNAARSRNSHYSELLRSRPGPFTNSTNPPIWPLFPFSTPELRPVWELSLSPYLLTSCADSLVSFLVSFTQRPELAAISEPFCATPAASPRAGRSRCSPRSFDGGLSAEL